MDKRLIFSHTYFVWNELGAQFTKPLINISKCKSSTYKNVAKIANVAKKTIIIVAFAIATIATAGFSLLALPYKYYKYQIVFKAAYKEDIARLTNAEKESIRREVVAYIDSHQCPILKKDKEQCIERIIASCGRSLKIYGPIVRAWTEYLLEKAHRENKRLVFLARDGIAPYKLAKKLMAQEEHQKKYPGMADNGKLVLAYFSRALVSSSTKTEEGLQLFKEYAEKELGIRPESKYIFVDIGFTGSMIKTIRAALPSTAIEYEYLISMTEEANGFLATQEMQLGSVPSAGRNLGIHWLEDTHQGNIKSPSHLVRVGDRIYPNTKQGTKKEYYAELNSLDFLIRKFSQIAVVKAFELQALNSEQLKEARSNFNEILERIRNTNLPLYVEH